MTKPKPTDLSASVRARLFNLSKKNGEDFSLTLTRYAIERLLYRLGKSKFRNQFLLKGATLFAIWEPGIHRPTRDLDLLGFGSSEQEEVRRNFIKICQTEAPPDGLIFSTEHLRVSEIREDSHYGGLRVQTIAYLGNARISIQVDVGYGDAVTPEPDQIVFPTLLDFDAPSIKAYPIYTVIAEKTEAIVALGEINTRMKDFFDLRFLSQKFEFEGPTLIEAIKATFKQRGTSIPQETPFGLSVQFGNDSTKQTQWSAFLRRNRLETVMFSEALSSVRQFVAPALLEAASIGQGKELDRWTLSGGWR
ncbi:MAG: nucleotidyl transferase AbiEii/AbiGii toxin family protein [Opitutaceae bacterium]|jgi:hypothetical protein|nr:nucleotidyl transferase AbiEii/AbiGii toxin family protein [Opitutaceae bacterium]